MKLALHSANPRLGDVAANVQAVAKAVARREADITVFPEMFLTGYAVGDAAQRLAMQCAAPGDRQPPTDRRLQPIMEACRQADAYAITGTPRTTRAGLSHNSALMVSPDGQLTWYDKRALPTFTTFSEGLYFTPGTQSPVWSTPWGRIGIGICYDLYFPEFQKHQVLGGADVLLNLSASPSPSRPFFEALLQARAIENACFSAYSNNCGAQDNLVFWGGAQAFGARGQSLGALAPYQEGRLVVELDLADLRAAREFRPTLRDSDPAEVAALQARPRHAMAALQGSPQRVSPARGAAPKPARAATGSKPAKPGTSTKAKAAKAAKANKATKATQKPQATKPSRRA